MFTSILIANRGEIACRVIRTAKRMGLRAIAVYSEADVNAPHVRMADEAHLIGPAPARESYLVAERILAAARKSKAQCIHPGYGFLSENAEFAEACAAAGIVFIGPPPAAIRAMGLKDAAKALAEKAGVPVVPGYHGERQDVEFLKKRAENAGLPVLIKAIAGGGGKGMRRVDRMIDFADALASARREAKSAFGDDRVLIEKYVTTPRHIEFQVFGDQHGNVVHLFERDCSMQRRHQKVIEEAPAPGMTKAVRAAMGAAAVNAAKSVGYVGAGTVEFIVDGSRALRPDGFWFMEMNTRLQVEHPVTEEITGLDLVELQLRVAAGEPLPFMQDDLAIHGHAVEARLYAEDPEKGFLPSTGKLYALNLPQGDGVRVDAGIEEGGEVSPYYDPMIAKIIAHGETRSEALDRLSSALKSTIVAGPKTNISFLHRLINDAGFRSEKLDTGLIERSLEQLGAVEQPVDTAAARVGALSLIADSAAARARQRAAQSNEKNSAWDVWCGFSLAGPLSTTVACDVEGSRMAIAIGWDGRSACPGETVDASARVIRADGQVIVLRNGRQTRVTLIDPLDVDLTALDGASDGVVKSPMHGKLIALLVEAGASVEKGQKLAIVEAMKMEHALTAPRAGTVSAIMAIPGQQVAEGAKILTVAE